MWLNLGWKTPTFSYTLSIFPSVPYTTDIFVISTGIEWSTDDLFVLMLMNDCLIPILSDFGAVESIASPWRGNFVIHQPSRLSGLNHGLARAVHCTGHLLCPKSLAWRDVPHVCALCAYKVCGPRMAVITPALQWRRKGEVKKKKQKHLTCTNSRETMLVNKGLKTKHPVSAQLGKLANNVPFPLTNVWQLAFANHSLLTLWCMSWIPTGGYRRSLLTLNLAMTNGVPVNVRFLGRGRGSF